MGPRSGAVDFIGQNDVGEDRALLKDKLPALGIVDAHAEDIAGQQVGRRASEKPVGGPVEKSARPESSLRRAGDRTRRWLNQTRTSARDRLKTSSRLPRRARNRDRPKVLSPLNFGGLFRRPEPPRRDTTISDFLARPRPRF